MPRWLLNGFFAASVALFAAAWVALFVQRGSIADLRRNIDRVDAQISRMNALAQSAAQ